MKYFICSIVLLLSINANATHWGEYFIYVESEYVQGPWSGMQQVEASNNFYLRPILKEGLFGSVETEMIGTFLSDLKAEKPSVYQWEYELLYKEDTVIIEPKGRIGRWLTVKDEITATLALNNFPNIKFIFADSTIVTGIGDVTVPYMDLRVVRSDNAAADTSNSSLPDQYDSTPADVKSEENASSIWFYLSIALNVFLLVFLLIRKKK